MFFITRLTENTNLAIVMPSDEACFNAARVNVQLARKEFAHLDIVEKKGKDVQYLNATREHGAIGDDGRGSEDDYPTQGVLNDG